MIKLPIQTPAVISSQEVLPRNYVIYCEFNALENRNLVYNEDCLWVTGLLLRHTLQSGQKGIMVAAESENNLSK